MKRIRPHHAAIAHFTSTARGGQQISSLGSAVGRWWSHVAELCTREGCDG